MIASKVYNKYVACNYGDSAEFRIDELDLGAVPSVSTKVNVFFHQQPLVRQPFGECFMLKHKTRYISFGGDDTASTGVIKE